MVTMPLTPELLSGCRIQIADLLQSLYFFWWQGQARTEIMRVSDRSMIQFFGILLDYIKVLEVILSACFKTVNLVLFDPVPTTFNKLWLRPLLQLLDAMQHQQEQNDNISPRITRSKDQSAYHYNQEASKWRKKAWTQEEDQYLIKLVAKYGPQKWTIIAENMPGRIGKQCRERWHNHLNPDINKEEWTKNQEWILFILHKNMGNQWANFTKYLKGRTDNSIKNHWNSAMKKKSPQYLQRYKTVKAKLEQQKVTGKEIDRYLLDKLSSDQQVPEIEAEDQQKPSPQVKANPKSTDTIVYKQEEKKDRVEDPKTAKKPSNEREAIGSRQETATKSRRATQHHFGHHINTRLSQLSIFGPPSKENIVSAFSLLEEPEPVVLEPQPSFNDISLSIESLEELSGEGEQKGAQRGLNGLAGTDSHRMLPRGPLTVQRRSLNSFSEHV